MIIDPYDKDQEMKITMLTPDKVIFQGNVVSVKVPGVMGQFQILKNHAPIVSALEGGTVTLVAAAGTHQVYDEESGDIIEVEEPGQRYTFQIEGGFIEVLNNEISLLVSSLVNGNNHVAAKG